MVQRTICQIKNFPIVAEGRSMNLGELGTMSVVLSDNNRSGARAGKIRVDKLGVCALELTYRRGHECRPVAPKRAGTALGTSAPWGRRAKERGRARRCDDSRGRGRHRGLLELGRARGRYRTRSVTTRPPLAQRRSRALRYFSPC